MAEQQDMIALTAELRGLLLTPAKRTPATQHDDVSRRVNLLAVQYGNLTDGQAAFECIALIGLAQIKGNKDAAKKSLNFARWAESPPPQLAQLASDQERRGAVKLLSGLRAPWIAGHVGAALDAGEQDIALTTDLMEWAHAASASAADFVVTVAGAIQVGVGARAARLKLLQKLTLKHLAGNRLHAGESCPGAFLQMASAGKEAVSKFSVAGKDAAAMQDFVMQVIDQITTGAPDLLLQIGTAQAVAAAESITGKWTSGSKKRLELLAGRMLSAGALVRTGHTPGAAEDISAIFKFAAKVMPLEKTARKTAERQALLKTLMQGFGTDEATSTPSAVSQALLDQVASLLVAWDGGPGKLRDREEFTEVEQLIGEVASAASVERFGEAGRIIPYKPLEQSLVEQDGVIPESVRVEVPGVRVKREDGSHRILIKAVVSRA